ncbi:binding-protein-dependent transport system inner membrane protein [Gracilibacillus halophilus YIM-C55.5]|uniref:Binding-protein-dependent transport system inner membrane protein n=1 Tax=Gracilibacillus halophilus YIM-C55.5 TaxID=1308866 RepID=N4W8R8_9BACI|nr:ABC transporter permease subunit [Gracilibacillus halophilus]ENH95594.1 binding-protein-dependent transport system inner membrane protein [Gracilibacillus halophilus YIM-C55.5]
MDFENIMKRIAPPSNRPVRVKPMNQSAIVIRLTLLSLVILTIIGFFTYDDTDVGMLEGITATFTNFKVMFTEPHFNHFTFMEGLYQVLVTISLALLTTVIGAVISLMLGLLAAKNLSTPKISNSIKNFVAVVRAVPTVLWVLIFAIAAGLGSVAAVIGMTFHSVGYLIKAYSESFEELDDGVIEVLKASGANWWQIVWQAVIPSSMTYIISWTFLRFEINFSVAVAMGAAAGAGGIGYDLFMASSFYLDLRELGTITFYILVFAILLEIVAIRIKRHINIT